jgi:hypothetical protein
MVTPGKWTCKKQYSYEESLNYLFFNLVLYKVHLADPIFIFPTKIKKSGSQMGQTIVGSTAVDAQLLP